MERLDLVELDMSQTSRAAAMRVDGVLGADVLARATLELDAGAGRVRVLDPARFDGRALEWSTVVLDDTAPCVGARLGGSTLHWLRLDTGSNDTLSVAPWAVASLALAPTPGELEAVFLVGPFGHVRGWRGELLDVEVAGARLPRLPATFLDPASGEAGLLDDRWITGNLGLAALRGFRVVLDLPRRRVSLVPSAPRSPGFP